SDLTFRDLNWRSGSVAGFAGQMAEVLTFDNCRGLARGVPALILSTDLGGRWDVHSPFGFPYMTDVKTQTVFRFFGGEFAGDNSSLIIFDAPGTL
ncbi:hypothetical protein OLF88_11340, partial [Streptococcus pneumoniae]|nr:hypothetical protein [Streptococcus pneumoniae]